MGIKNIEYLFPYEVIETPPPPPVHLDQISAEISEPM